MNDISSLLLLSGNNIPFKSGRCVIHQPTIKEIAFIGEENYQYGTHFLMFSKNDLSEQDRKDLANYDDFDIFMSVINKTESKKHKTNVILILTLLFPEAKVEIGKDKILLHLENFETCINKENFKEFQDILQQIFCMNGFGNNTNFNPADDLARGIAEKFKKRQEKLAEKKEEKKKINIFSRYISILSVGLQKDMNELMQYTVYQLLDEFERFKMKQDFDVYVQARMAGAKDIDEVKNWMEEIH